MDFIKDILKFASGRFKKPLSRKSSLASFFSSAQSSFNISEDELIFEEMDLIIREEINKLEQALTDYLQAQIGFRINTQVEDRYITRITELYERWAHLEPPDNLSLNPSSASIFSSDNESLRKKSKDLKKRRNKIEKEIERRKQSWKKFSPKKVIVEFEDGILWGNGYYSNDPRIFNYTLITVYNRW
uniref:Uncharacterized protein n=1 Tax=Panagrolaimus davidi TaxID=227884 RepID=A0A914PGD0_9BILA